MTNAANIALWWWCMYSSSPEKVTSPIIKVLIYLWIARIIFTGTSDECSKYFCIGMYELRRNVANSGNIFRLHDVVSCNYYDYDTASCNLKIFPAFVNFFSAITYIFRWIIFTGKKDDECCYYCTWDVHILQVYRRLQVSRYTAFSYRHGELRFCVLNQSNSGL